MRIEIRQQQNKIMNQILNPNIIIENKDNNKQFQNDKQLNRIKQQQSSIEIIHKMTEQEQLKKKTFNIPSREQIIQSIKDLDQDIEHVSLNLIKCDFNATQNDIRKAFPQFNLIKVNNYNPGSFQVVFQMKIDAINFIRNYYDKKILARRFFIKMGRQQKQIIEDWTGVGNVHKNFRQKLIKDQKNLNYHKGKRPEDKTQDKTQQNTNEQKSHHQEEVKPKAKLQTNIQADLQDQPKKEGEKIPKFDNSKKTQYRKLHHPEGQKKMEVKAQKQGDHQKTKKLQPHQGLQKYQSNQTSKKDQSNQPPKKDQSNQPPKKDQSNQAFKKGIDKKEAHQQNQQKKEDSKKEQKKQASKIQELKNVEKKQVAKEQTPQQDSGWIVVGGGKNQRRR